MRRCSRRTEEGVVPADCTGCPAIQAEMLRPPPAEDPPVEVLEEEPLGVEDAAKQVQDNLFVAVGGQIEGYLLCSGTLSANANGNLFSAAGLIADVDRDLFRAGSAAAAGAEGAQVDDDFGAAGGCWTDRGWVYLLRSTWKRSLEGAKRLLRTG